MVYKTEIMHWDNSTLYLFSIHSQSNETYCRKKYCKIYYGNFISTYDSVNNNTLAFMYISHLYALLKQILTTCLTYKNTNKANDLCQLHRKKNCV